MALARSLFQKYSLEISDQEATLFERFLQEFMTYNAHTNLSAIRDEEGIIEKHFVDSCMLARFERLEWRMLDIGTGGGFPGIPLKIIEPSLEITLLDSVGKKIKACDTFISALGLQGISTIHGRAEELTRWPLRGSFDFVVSRATAYMPQILAWAEPFLGPRWLLVLYKLPSEEELQDAVPVLRSLWLRILREHSYEFSGQTRKLFVIAHR